MMWGISWEFFLMEYLIISFGFYCSVDRLLTLWRSLP